MLRIRLQRLGRVKNPTYRLIVSEGTKDTQAGSLEILGNYNPTANPKIIDFKEDRIKHWLSVGAQPSNTVQNLLVNKGIIDASKAKSVSITAKRTAKIGAKAVADKEKQEAIKEKEAAAKEAAIQVAKAEKEASIQATKVEKEATAQEVSAEMPEVPLSNE